MKIFDKKVKENFSHYILQCTLATITLLIVLLFLNLFTQTTIIASLGATTFIIFTAPKSSAGEPRKIIGGYVTGMVIGVISRTIANGLLSTLLFDYVTVVPIVFGAISVGLTIFVMVIIDTEHPPAVGLSLGLVISPWDIKTLVIVLSCVVFMYLIQRLLKPHLINLT